LVEKGPWSLDTTELTVLHRLIGLI